MWRAKFSAAISAFVIATPVCANWQYTEWGMTPEQVVAASGGSVALGSGTPGERLSGEDIAATGTYNSGEFRFHVNFYFVRNKLADVRLAVIGNNAYQLKNSLASVYGTPFDQSAYPATVVTYHDTVKNNRIDLMIITSSMATLEYRPLVDGNATGL